VIQYRRFRNTDPPAVAEVWNHAFTGRGAAELRGTVLLEYLTFAKPYFDPDGLILASADGGTVGLMHAGFGPDAAEQALDPTCGIVCTLGVIPPYRRQGIGGELLRRAEDYLRSRGARVLLAGPSGWLNPFSFGLYGGSQAPGFLDSDTMAGPFLQAHGYALAATRRVWQRRLERPPTINDHRFASLRQEYEIHGGPWRGAGWWRECVVGPVEVQEYRLLQKNGNRTAARARVWVLDTFGVRWGEQAVGLIGLDVEPDLRRRGLARFLLAQLLRHFHDQFFTLVEVQAPADDAAAEGLLRGLGFTVIDSGQQYRKA
jgi:ribosomal protein S18 acetylase RimI-like enzyme